MKTLFVLLLISGSAQAQMGTIVSRTDMECTSNIKPMTPFYKVVASVHQEGSGPTEGSVNIAYSAGLEYEMKPISVEVVPFSSVKASLKDPTVINANYSNKVAIAIKRVSGNQFNLGTAIFKGKVKVAAGLHPRIAQGATFDVSCKVQHTAGVYE